jgi:Putative peptidoglycan binding domain
MSDIHTVEQGEYLASIAKDYGFSDWHTIYDHPDNAELKKMRPNPDILLPGDELFIPDKQLKQESCATEKKHRFQVKVPKAFLKVVLKDGSGRPIKNQPYTLRVGWLTRKGTTDATGLVQQKVPTGIQDALLILDKRKTHLPLKIGHLDPIHDGDGKQAIVSGIQARLNNLGFECGKEDGDSDSDTQEALKRFQETAMGRQNPDGEPDQATLDALRQHHKS